MWQTNKPSVLLGYTAILNLDLNLDLNLVLNLVLEYSSGGKEAIVVCGQGVATLEYSSEYELAAYMHRNARRAPGFP